MPSKDKVKKKSKVKKEKIAEDIPPKHLKDVELSEEEINDLLSIDFGEYKKRTLKIKREIFGYYPDFGEDTPNDAKMLFMLCARIFHEIDMTPYRKNFLIETFLDTSTMFFELYTPVKIKEKDIKKYSKLVFEHTNVMDSNCLECDKYYNFEGLSVHRNIEFLHKPCRIEVVDKNYNYKYMIDTMINIIIKSEFFKISEEEYYN